MPPSTLVGISAFIVVALGLGHLVLTYFSHAFSPRDPALEVRLKEVSPFITTQTTMWRGHIGFHASHSLGAIAFGAIYSYLALTHSALLFQSHFLVALGAVVLLSYVVLARLYWFILPLAGLVLAFVLYVAGVVVAYA
jgi:hypothetical protein